VDAQSVQDDQRHAAPLPWPCRSSDALGRKGIHTRDVSAGHTSGHPPLVPAGPRAVIDTDGAS